MNFASSSLHQPLMWNRCDVESLDQRPADAELLSVNGLEFAVHTAKAGGEKCVRCWHLREDVGSDSEHPEVCGRCISNVHGSGEQRSIA